MNLNDHIRTVENFPKDGISYKDITTLLLNPKVCQHTLNQLAEPLLNQHIDKVIGIESRGFLFGFLLAQRLNVGFVPIRKPGKLPHDTLSKTYELEYGSDTIEIHKDAINKNDRIIIHDDVLATGGTAQAACQLVEQLGGDIVELNFLIQLRALKGQERVKSYNYRSLLHY
jgi:adenine phosphoribosyltransferase